MKKLLFFTLILCLCIFLVGCFSEPLPNDEDTDESTVHETESETESDTQDSEPITEGIHSCSRDFYTVEEYLRYLVAVSPDVPAHDPSSEERVMDYPSYAQWLGEIKERETVEIPYWGDAPMALTDRVTLFEYDKWELPSIWFRPLNGDGANIIKIAPLPENYDTSEIFAQLTDAKTKTRVLADRSVTVYVSSVGESATGNIETFLYGKLLIRITSNTGSITDEWYSKLSFQEVSLPQDFSYTSFRLFDEDPDVILYEGMNINAFRYHRDAKTGGIEGDSASNIPRIYQYCFEDANIDSAKSLYIWLYQGVDENWFVERFEWVDRTAFEYPETGWLYCECHGRELAGNSESTQPHGDAS